MKIKLAFLNGIYEYHVLSDTLDLLSHGTHENFYRDLKRGI